MPKIGVGFLPCPMTPSTNCQIQPSMAQGRKVSPAAREEGRQFTQARTAHSRPGRFRRGVPTDTGAHLTSNMQPGFMSHSPLAQHITHMGLCWEFSYPYCRG